MKTFSDAAFLSDQGLHCLPITLLGVFNYNGLIRKILIFSLILHENLSYGTLMSTQNMFVGINKTIQIPPLIRSYDAVWSGYIFLFIYWTTGYINHNTQIDMKSNMRKCTIGHMYLVKTLINLHICTDWSQSFYQPAETLEPSSRKHAYIILTPLNPIFI